MKNMDGGHCGTSVALLEGLKHDILKVQQMDGGSDLRMRFFPSSSRIPNC